MSTTRIPIFFTIFTANHLIFCGDTIACYLSPNTRSAKGETLNQHKTFGTWILLAAMTFGPVGCISQVVHDKLLLAHRRTQEQIVDLKLRLEQARSHIQALEEAPQVPDPQLLNNLEIALAERDRLTEALKDAESRMRELSTQVPVLPPDLDAALAKLANEHAQIMSYDGALGMVKLKSDLTFSLGSAKVSDNGAASLQALAEILKSVAAAPYGARIVGHTDTVPIQRPETRRHHPTNWHLSAHRAIAVKDVLEKTGVEPKRILVAGRGEHHPIVSNGPRGAEANRRVEIFLVPRTASALVAAPETVDALPETEPETDPMK